MPDPARSLPWRVVAVPAVITLAVTLLRLAGELQNWSPLLFSRAPGGGGAIVGISWLVPIFGIYFAVRLARAGEAPGRALRAFGFVVLALLILPIFAMLGGWLLRGGERGVLAAVAVASVISVPIAMQAWPALGRTLLAYALAARVPVAILILFAVLGNWGTHYDATGPGFPAMPPLQKWFWIGLVPQMTMWIAFTVVVGTLFGLVAGLVAARGRQTRTAAATA